MLGRHLWADLHQEDRRCSPAIFALLQPVTDFFPIAKSRDLAAPRLPITRFPSRQLQSLQFFPVSLSSKARFSAFQQARQVRAMPYDYDRCQAQRKIKWNRCRKFFQKQHDSGSNRKRDRRRYRSDRYISSRLKHCNPNGAHDQCHYPIDAKKSADRCSNPFPTTKSKPYRIAVSDHRKKSADYGVKVDKLRARLSALAHNHGHLDRSQALSQVQDKDRIPKPLAEYTGNVCCTHIAATDLTNVDARESSGNVTSRERSEKISNQRDANESKHGRLVGSRSDK